MEAVFVRVTDSLQSPMPSRRHRSAVAEARPLHRSDVFGGSRMDGVCQPVSGHVQQLEQAKHLLEAVQARLRMRAGTRSLPEGMHPTGRLREGEERQTKEATEESRKNERTLAECLHRSADRRWFLDETTRKILKSASYKCFVGLHGHLWI